MTRAKNEQHMGEKLDALRAERDEWKRQAERAVLAAELWKGRALKAERLLTQGRAGGEG